MYLWGSRCLFRLVLLNMSLFSTIVADLNSLKHRRWQFLLLQQSPQLWNTSVWLLRAIAFESTYFEVHRPVYLVALRLGFRQNCSVSQASLARPRMTTYFLLHAGFSCKNEIFPNFEGLRAQMLL